MRSSLRRWTMKSEEYFDLEEFDTPHGQGRRLRLKGNRIDIDDVLRHLNEGRSPENIVAEVYSTLSLDQVHACVDYYRQHKDEVDQMVAESDRIGEAYYQEWLKTPNPLVDRLRALKAAREKNGQA